MLDKKILEIEASKENLTQSLEEFKQTIRSNQEKIDLLEKEKTKSSETLEATHRKLNETEVELKEAMAKIADMETQRDDLKELLETKEGEFVQSLDELENDLSEKSRQCDESKASIRKLEKSVEALKTDLELKSEQCSQSVANGNCLEETIKNLKNEMSTLQKVIFLDYENLLKFYLTLI